MRLHMQYYAQEDLDFTVDCSTSILVVEVEPRQRDGRYRFGANCGVLERDEWSTLDDKTREL